MNDELTTLKERICACMDELALLDILGLDVTDLVELLEEQIEEAKQELLSALG